MTGPGLSNYNPVELEARPHWEINLYRRTPAAHKSLMLLTAISFLPPALGRISIAPLQALGPLWFFGFPALLALVCLGLEARRHGRLNRVFLAGTVALIVSASGGS